MNVASPALSRRAFLRGTGVSLALPFLDAMWPQRMFAASAMPPKRMVTVCASLGIYPADFFPKEAGRDYAPSPYLEVIKEHRNTRGYGESIEIVTDLILL